MVKDVGPGDRIIDGNMIRTGADQITSFRDMLIPEDTDDYDAYRAAVDEEDENGEPVATIRDIGEREDDQNCTLRNNPWGPSDNAGHWEDGSGPAAPWEVGIDCLVPNLYEFEGSNYMAIQSHVSQADWQPNAQGILGVLFVLVPPPTTGTPDWLAGVQYAVDDEVMYGSIKYSCIQAHTSQVGWEPPNVPTLWQPVAADNRVFGPYTAEDNSKYWFGFRRDAPNWFAGFDIDDNQTSDVWISIKAISKLPKLDKKDYNKMRNALKKIAKLDIGEQGSGDEPKPV